MKFLHSLGHRHYELFHDDIGTFSFCEQRWPWGGCRVMFQPAFASSRWWGVPYAEHSEDGTLLQQMIRAQNAHQAMALLRAEYAKTGGYA